MAGSRRVSRDMETRPRTTLSRQSVSYQHVPFIPDENLEGDVPFPEVDSGLIRGADLCLAAVILVVPFVMGGRTPLGELILVGMAALGAICWTLSQCLSRRPAIRWSGAEILFLGGILLGVLQLVPFDSNIIQNVSPETSVLLPLRSGLEANENGLGVWNQLSLYPAVTRQGLILLGAYSLIFLTTLQRIRSGKDVEWLLKLVGASVTAMALFGLVQYFAGNGKFFWFYEHPQANASDYVKGAFSNRNHFAQFMAIGVGPLLWLVLQVFQPVRHFPKVRRGQPDSILFVAVIGLGLVMFAALLSLSRGGAVAVFAACTVGLGFSSRAGLLNTKVMLGLAASAVLLGAGLFIYGQDRVSDRIDDLLSGDLKRLDHRDGRIDLWKTVWSAGSHFPYLGTGIGTHREVYPAFQHVPAQHDFTHAENGYLQIFEETGWVGLGLMLLGIALCGIWLLRGSNPRNTKYAGCAAACAAALSANAVHSLGDFVWYAPGIMAVIVILAACTCRLSQISQDRFRSPRPFPRLLYGAFLGLIIYGGYWSSPQLVARVLAEPAWEKYQKLAVVRPDEVNEPVDTKIRNPSPQIIALRNVVKSNPEDARAHSRLARLYLLQFHLLQKKSDNQMDVEHIREAVWNSEFENVDQMQAWIEKAFGKSHKLLELALYHSRQSLKHSPLPGDAYLYFSKLRFLENPQREDLSEYWDQAVKLRPVDGNVLFAAGKEYALALNNEKSMEYWKRAYHAGPSQQQQLIELLATHLHAEEFLKLFEPDIHSVPWLVKKFRDQKLESDLKITLSYYASISEEYAKTVDGTPGAHAWLGAFNAYRDLKNEVQANRCLQQALEVNDNDYEVRYAAGQWAVLHKDYVTAEEHLSWCAERRPENDVLQEMVRQISHKAEGSRVVDPLPTVSEENLSGAGQQVFE